MPQRLLDQNCCCRSIENSIRDIWNAALGNARSHHRAAWPLRRRYSSRSLRESRARPTSCTETQKQPCSTKWMPERHSRAIASLPSPAGGSAPADRQSPSAPGRPPRRTRCKHLRRPRHTATFPPALLGLRGPTVARAPGKRSPRTSVMMRPPSLSRQHDGQGRKAAMRPKPSPPSETSRLGVRRELMAPGTSLALVPSVPILSPCDYS